MTEKIRNKAKELLEKKSVSVVIGYEEGTAGVVRPSIIMDPARADKLLFDERCNHNIAVYLTRKEVKKAGKAAIFASIYVLKSIVVLIGENQVKEENVLIIGMDNGNLIEFENIGSAEKFINSYEKEIIRPKDKALLEKIEAMDMEQRWEYWQKELSKCFKCFACRAACPMCYCDHCTVNCNQPQWITVPASELGNLEWHMMRAMHLAGRCINCGQCADACPLDIPINILTLKISEDIAKNFKYQAGTNVQQEYVLSTYKPNDKENFIA